MGIVLKFLLIFVLPTALAFNLNDGYPTKCANFTDKRTNINAQANFIRTFLTIPSHLTSNGQREIRFFLANNHGISIASTHEEQCKFPEIVEIPMTVDERYRGTKPSKYPFQEQWKFAKDTYFTVDGYFHQESDFWSPDDYCVESVSDTHLIIKLCKLNCSADLLKSYLLTTNNDYYEPSRICIPKCCGIDETLNLQDQTCRKLNDTEPNYFMPYLHLQQEIWFLKDSNTKNVDTHKVLVRPTLGRRQPWNSTHGISGGGKIWGLLHFNRNTMNCSKFSTESVFYQDVTNHGKNSKKRYNIRVEVKPGRVQITLLTRSRKWMEYQQEFCVDGLDGWGINEGNEAVNQVVLMCQNDNDISENIKFVDEYKVAKASPSEYIYMVVTLLLAILLIFGSLMYWTIRKKLNFRGNLIRGHLNSLAGLYLYTFVALIMEIRDYINVGSNAVTVVTSEYKEGKRIGWFCVLIGAICHYVYLSVYFWIGAMMCYDLFWRMLLGGCSEKMRKVISMAIGLGAPLVLMIAFGIADIFYGDPWLDVIVPDYGVESCFIASWSSGYYLHLPVAIIIGLIILNGFVWFGLNFTANFEESGIWLLVVVLSTLLFRWIIDATKWLRVYSGQKEDNWYQTIISFVGVLLPALMIFHVYCMNEVVLGLVGYKMSSISSFAKVLKNKKLIWSGRGLIGQICDEVSDEDTVIIEGDIMLKERITH